MPADARCRVVPMVERRPPSSSSPTIAIGDEDRVDRRAAGLDQYTSSQVQDQRELVEHQRHADAEEADVMHRAESARSGSAIAADAADDHEDHAEHDVVDVHTAGRDVARPPLHLSADHPYREADEQERDQHATNTQNSGSRPDSTIVR